MAEGLSISNTTLVPNLWETELITEIRRDMFFNKFIGKDANNIIQIKDDFKVKQGNNIKFGLRLKLSGDGVDGDGDRAGHEEALDVKDDSCGIDQKWHGVLLKGKMEEQKACYNLRMEAKAGLKEWWSELLDEYLLRFLGGDTTLTFANDGTAPQSSRQVYAGAATAANEITSAMKFDVDCIRKAKQKAKMASPKVPPLRIKGKAHYVLFLHPYQVDDLKKDSEYLQSLREAGWRGDKNPIFSGALSVIDGVILHEHEKILTFATYGGTGNLPAARSILCGRQAALLARGSEGPNWHEEMVDRGSRYSFSGAMIFGIKKAVFSSKDFAVVACDTYADEL